MEVWGHKAEPAHGLTSLPLSQRWQDLNVISSLLKSFFRKLPEPLFTDGEQGASGGWERGDMCLCSTRPRFKLDSLVLLFGFLF